MSDIDQLRNRVDEITLEMIRMLKKRTELAKELGRIKETIGRGVTDEAREENLRRKVLSVSDSLGLDGAISLRFLNFLLNESVKIQSADRPTHLSIFRKAKSLEENGKKIIHMEVGEPDFMPPKSVGQALGQAYQKGLVGYGQASGMVQFRQALANHNSERFGIKLSQNNILVSPGGRFSVFAAISTLLNYGDEIIVIEPAWPAYKECALYSGVKVRTVITTLEEKWEPSTDQIRGMINTNTKMIVLNYPNNPTGKILPRDIQDDIMKIAEENDLYVLSDEIYSDYAYSDWKSVLSYNYEKSVVVQSFSKSHAMTGFRIGYTMASEDIVGKMAGISALCLTSVAEPIQYSAMKALEADTSDSAKMVRRRLDVLVKRAQDMDLEFVKPDGAMYLYVKIDKEGFDGIQFADSLLEKGLAIAPGEGFGNYKSFMRISACQNENILKQGMDILSNGLSMLQ